MTKPLLAVLFLASWLGLPATGPAQIVTDLHDFGGPNDGRNPAGSLLLSGSTFFGMTSVGPGFTGAGTIFKMNTDGSGFSTMHAFTSGLNDGDTPNGSLVQVGSKLYGMTQGGGTGGHGIIFSIGTDSTGFTILHRFAAGPTDGSSPLGTLTLSGSVLYGMTSSGGSVPNSNGLYQNGTIFKMNLDGNGYQVLHNFGGFPTDGQFPAYGAMAVSGDKLFGTTVFGGSAGAGTVFSLTTDGTGYTTLRSFTAVATDGGTPEGQLITSGTALYGLTVHGGDAGRGTVYSMGTDGSAFTVLHDFEDARADGSLPVGELTIDGGRLYGTSGRGGRNSLGTILGIDTDGGNYDMSYSFSGAPTDGDGPVGQMVQSRSAFFGMTGQGGIYDGGTVFTFVPVPEPSSMVLTVAVATLATVVAIRREKRKSS